MSEATTTLEETPPRRSPSRRKEAIRSSLRHVFLAAHRWQARPWADEDLAARVGITVDHLHVVRHRYFDVRDFTRGRDSHGRMTFHLTFPTEEPADPHVDHDNEWAWVVGAAFALVSEQQQRIAKLEARNDELERVIVDERIRRRRSGDPVEVVGRAALV